LRRKRTRHHHRDLGRSLSAKAPPVNFCLDFGSQRSQKGCTATFGCQAQRLARASEQSFELEQDDPVQRSVLTYFGVALALVMMGCTAKSSPDPGAERETHTGQAGQQSAGVPAATFSHVLVNEAEYYTTGPQQGRPPDGKFPAGTKVSIVRQAGSYTLVRSEGGIEAYVAADIVKTNDREHNEPKK
jgi:hypothetical protein